MRLKEIDAAAQMANMYCIFSGRSYFLYHIFIVLYKTCNKQKSELSDEKIKS